MTTVRTAKALDSLIGKEVWIQFVAPKWKERQVWIEGIDRELSWIGFSEEGAPYSSLWMPLANIKSISVGE